MMKIAVAGIGYVGLSNAVLLAQHNEVTAVDVSKERVDKLNQRQSPIIDKELQEYLSSKELHLTATTNAREAYKDAEFVIIATPTNYDLDKNFLTPAPLRRSWILSGKSIRIPRSSSSPQYLWDIR